MGHVDRVTEIGTRSVLDGRKHSLDAFENDALDPLGSLCQPGPSTEPFCIDRFPALTPVRQSAITAEKSGRRKATAVGIGLARKAAVSGTTLWANRNASLSARTELS